MRWCVLLFFVFTFPKIISCLSMTFILSRLMSLSSIRLSKYSIKEQTSLMQFYATWAVSWVWLCFSLCCLNCLIQAHIFYIFLALRIWLSKYDDTCLICLIDVGTCNLSIGIWTFCRSLYSYWLIWLSSCWFSWLCSWITIFLIHGGWNQHSKVADFSCICTYN